MVEMGGGQAGAGQGKAKEGRTGREPKLCGRQRGLGSLQRGVLTHPDKEWSQGQGQSECFGAIS